MKMRRAVPLSLDESAMVFIGDKLYTKHKKYLILTVQHLTLIHTYINTYVTKVLLLPLVPKGGGFHGTPWEKHFPTGICNKIYTTYVRDINNHNSEKKKLNVVPFQNGGQITDFYFAPFRFWPNFEKPLSQRNFSMKFGSKKENINRFTLLKYNF